MPWNGQGNLPDQARRARYDLMAAWGQSKGIDLIALGHTADDQAETFLMRLARSSGADGLAAMATRRRHGAVTYLRPVLGLRRADLRAFLTRRDVVWMEDPSNADPKYTRTQAREALRVLAPLGIDVPTLTTVADNLSSIRKALNWYSFTEARNHVCIDQSDVVIDLAAYRTLPAEIARRILQFACLWITGAEYTPRRNGMALLAEALKSGRGMTLAGTHASVARGEIRITRELAATASAIPVTAPDVPVIWDHRWRVQGPAPHRSCQPMIPEKPSVALNDARKMGAAPKQKADQSDAQLTIAAIGKDGLAQCPQWRETGVPRLSLLAAPAVWRGSDLVAAPLAGYPNGWSANLCRGEEDFFTSILTH